MPARLQAAREAVRLRRGAERRLETRRPQPGQARIEADVKRLVHELQVHQIELEMQNAELQDARVRTESLLEQYTNLYDFAPVGYFSLAANGRVQQANLMGARLVGLERSRVLGALFRRFVAPRHRAEFDAFLQRVLTGAGRQGCEVAFHGEGCPPRTVSIEAEPTREGDECRAVVVDVTERKRAEAAQRRADVLAAANAEAKREIARRRIVEATLRRSERTQRRLVVEAEELHAELRHLTRQILRAQEEERKNISRELHDEIAQILAGINVQLAALASSGLLPPRDLRRRIQRTQQLVVQSITAVHRFARELRPALLDDLGLIPALRSYIRDLPGRRGLRVRFIAAPEVEALDPDRRTVLYRVAQEALTNVVRHAHARQVTVRVSRVGDAVRLVVRDDGRSFPVDRILRTNTRKRLGLLGMRERVEVAGGRFAIASSPDRGTTVQAEVPVRKTRG